MIELGLLLLPRMVRGVHLRSSLRGRPVAGFSPTPIQSGAGRVDELDPLANVVVAPQVAPRRQQLPLSQRVQRRLWTTRFGPCSIPKIFRTLEGA
jgi:hypothetical protein